MAIYNSSVLRAVSLAMQMVPKEGPLGVPLNFDFSAQPFYLVDFSEATQQNRISCVQSLYIDASGVDAPIVVQDQSTGFTIVAMPRTQGFYQFMTPNPAKIQVSCASAVSGVQVFAYNIAIPSAVWSATHP